MAGLRVAATLGLTALAAAAATPGLAAQAIACDSVLASPFLGGAFSGAGVDYERVRLLELAGAAGLRPTAEHRPSDWLVHPPCDPSPAPSASGFEIVPALAPVAFLLGRNSAYPTRTADGGLWAGRGVSLGVTGGAAVRASLLTVAIRPELYFAENLGFPWDSMAHPGHSKFIDPSLGTAIDLPQRFGADPRWTRHPGQTVARVDAFGLVAGASTENVRWGPALRYPLLLSTTAPGFPHAFVGTSRPIDLRVGHLEVRTLLGILQESEFFDFLPGNDRRYISGIAAAFRPSFLPGLSLGVTRSYLVRLRPDTTRVLDVLRRAFLHAGENPGHFGSDPTFADDQLVALFGRWVFPEIGVELYGEFGRTDHWMDILDLAKAPQASRAFNWGVHKLFTGERVSWRVLFEAVNLSDPLPSLVDWRGILNWYIHGQLRQGYTHRGQLLGAPVGPGGIAQTLAVDAYSAPGSLGVELTRTVYNSDSYNSRWFRYYSNFGNDLELTALLRASAVRGAIEGHARVGYSRRWNRDFLRLEEFVGFQWSPSDFLTETNWSTQLEIRWRLPGLP